MTDKKIVGSSIVVLASALFASCAHQQVKPTTQPQAASSSTGASQSELNVRNDSMRSILEMKTIHFEYDSAFLKSEARAVLRANAAWLREHNDVRVQVAGHCDQRGTVEYNLALGERRAASIRDYYVHLGVPASSIATISYGKEKPLCQEMEETCWKQNRRGETLEVVGQ